MTRDDARFIHSREFFAVVGLLRELPPELQLMCLHASLFWSSEQLVDAALHGNDPALPAGPHLRIVQ